MYRCMSELFIRRPENCVLKFLEHHTFQDTSNVTKQSPHRALGHNI